MANCPNCGSEHITLKRETNVSWGRAIAGWALFGVVGGAVGAVTGEDRNVNACLTCGASWKAANLFQVIQTIKKFTESSLAGCFGGCLFSSVILFGGSAAAAMGGIAFLLIIAFPLIGFAIGQWADSNNKKNIERLKEQAETKAKNMYLNAECQLKNEVKIFMHRHPYISS